MDESIIRERYKEYLRENERYWCACNNVLYDMCKDYPNHNNADIVASKLLIIGRTYAAALEINRNNVEVDSDTFYYEYVVSPWMMEEWVKLGKLINEIKKQEGKNPEGLLDKALKIHRKMVDNLVMADGKGKKKERRSLASKYLHFHNPDLFFIYDERARKVIADLKIPYDPVEENESEYDREYKIFTERMINLQEILNELRKELDKKDLCKIDLSPRGMDDFLLWYYRKKINNKKAE